MDETAGFEAERPRLVAIAARVLDDHAEAEDVVQQAWLRLHRTRTTTDTVVDDLPAWLTTVTTRLCLDRLRARTPVLVELHETATTPYAEGGPEPADGVEVAHDVGTALHVVLDRLPPRERVAFVLHDGFGYDFPTIATVLDTSHAAARKLASRARGRLVDPPDPAPPADGEVVDAFMSAARGGDLHRLLRLLAPDAEVTADRAAVLVGTPGRISGRRDVAAFFDGSARSALAVLVDDRPGAAWYDRGTPRVLFDFTVADGLVRAITFRADPEVLARVVRRSSGRSHPGAAVRQGGGGSGQDPDARSTT